MGAGSAKRFPVPRGEPIPPPPLSRRARRIRGGCGPPCWNPGFPRDAGGAVRFRPGRGQHPPAHMRTPSRLAYISTTTTTPCWAGCGGLPHSRACLRPAVLPGSRGRTGGEGGYQNPLLPEGILKRWLRSAPERRHASGDLCGFGNNARMNIPGVPENNFWRITFRAETLAGIDKAYYKEINRL